MSKCRRCNRALKREPYRSEGIGKICKAKEQRSTAAQSQETGDVIVQYDGGDIWLERIPCPTFTGRTGNQISMEQHTASGIKTNVQRKEVKHSPSGFNFGYGGSGPADTALNIMLMFTDHETAHAIYQDFKWKFLGEQGNKLVIPKAKILEFIAEHKAVLAD